MHENVIVIQRVNAPVEKVWSAITNKAQMKEWYYDIPDFELGLHNEFNFYEPGGANKYHHQGEILEVIPNEKFKYSWSYPEISKERTIVKWELEKRGDETEITLTHKGLENLDHLGEDFQMESFEKGWLGIVGHRLKAFVEK